MQATWKGYKARKEWAANRNGVVGMVKRAQGRLEEADMAAASLTNLNGVQPGGATGAARRGGGNALLRAASALMSSTTASKGGDRHTVLLAGGLPSKRGGKAGEQCRLQAGQVARLCCDVAVEATWLAAYQVECSSHWVLMQPVMQREQNATATLAPIRLPGCSMSVRQRPRLAH